TARADRRREEQGDVASQVEGRERAHRVADQQHAEEGDEEEDEEALGQERAEIGEGVEGLEDVREEREARGPEDRGQEPEEDHPTATAAEGVAGRERARQKQRCDAAYHSPSAAPTRLRKTDSREAASFASAVFPFDGRRAARARSSARSPSAIRRPR